MKSFVAGHEVLSVRDFAELSLGIDFELFTGPPGESRPDRRVRLAVAREVLAELRVAGESDERSAGAAQYAAALLRGGPVRPGKAVA